MFSYVFMKILEGRPRSYDRRMDQASRGRVRAMKLAVAEAVPAGARVLEIGCGTGELASMMIAQGARVDGFDLSPSMLAAARGRIAAESLEDRFGVRQMGVDGMDGLDARAYDVVVATLVFSELTDDERRFALAQAHRVLVPGGLLVVADEVVPRSIGRRWAHRLVRAPLAAATFLAARSSTRAISDLTGDIVAAGFAVDREQRSHGDAFAQVVAHRPIEAAGS